MKNEPIPSSMEEFNSQKWVLLIEEAPLTDKFVQIMLTADMAKAISKTLFGVLPHSKKHPGAYVIPTEDAHSAYLPNIRFSYPDKDLQDVIDDLA